MSVIASVRVPVTDFVLGDVFADRGGVTVRVESFVPISSGMMPYLWLEPAGRDHVQSIRRASAVEHVEVIDEGETEQLLAVEWCHDGGGLTSVLQDTAAVVLEAAMEETQWVFRLRFPGYEALSTFSRRCRENDIELELQQLYSPPTSADDSPPDLTPEQREVLVTARDLGYFEVPRQATLDELGAALDISDSAASQRLRRAFSTMVADISFDGSD